MITLQKLVTDIHASNTRAVVIVTGGGSGVFPLLLNQGGGSNTLVSGFLPWSDKETVELLGFRPEKFASEETVRQLAVVAYRKALAERTLASPKDQKCIGVACSSILQRTPTEREDRRHVIYAALHTAEKTIAVTVDLTTEPMPLWEQGGQIKQLIPDAYVTRRAEEDANARLLLHLIAVGSGCVAPPAAWSPADQESQFPATELFSWSPLQHLSIELLPSWLKLKVQWKESTLQHSDLLAFSHRGVGFVAFRCGTTLSSIASVPLPKILFPGSFNPFHSGHAEMVFLAEKEMSPKGYRCALELSLANYSKPNLDWIEVERRLRQIAMVWAAEGHKTPLDVYITEAPLFVHKIPLFPGVTFVVGHDTAERMVDPLLDTSTQLQVRLRGSSYPNFFVFGREINGEFRSGPGGFPEWFVEHATWSKTPRNYTHVSSTQIREALKK